MPAYDFFHFATSLLDLTPNEMLFSVEEEAETVAKVRHEDPMIRFRREDYERKLYRLRAFLRTGRVPESLTPKERQAYGEIAARLLARGVVSPALFELRGAGNRPIAGSHRHRTREERRKKERRKSTAAYSGPERRRAADRRSEANRRAVRVFNSL
jgi:hypothetical protein